MNSNESVKYEVGMLVENTGAPEWGPGKIVHIAGDKLHIIFRDLEENMARQFRVDSPTLLVAADQYDPVLDNLPPLIEKDGRWILRKRLSLETLKRKFLHEFPAGFSDPKYLSMERDYKLAAHLKFQTLLGLDQARRLLARGDIKALAAKALSVLAAVNLISPYESAAFHDAMQDESAVAAFFSSFLRLLDKHPVDSRLFSEYADAVCSLPADRGRVASWPVATAFPYLARPDRHMFLKPQVTQNAAETLGFDLKYDATPSWKTYEALLRMGTVYLNMLKPLGARDFIDVQSFIYVSCGGYETMRAKRAAK